MSDAVPFDRLPEGPWNVEGRLVEASNVVLRLVQGDPRDATSPRAVYKPVSGERPLDDFPHDTLAHREVAAWLVAQHAGWDCVPETVWYTGEFGDGSLQRWVGPLQPEEQDVVDLLTPTELDERDDWYPIAAFESDDGPLLLAHADDDRLRLIAALDVVLANADRKGSHLIESAGRLYAIDNGLSFHVEDKLRTVLWGWAGDELGAQVEAGLRRLHDDAVMLRSALAPHLSDPELDALEARITALLANGVFPDPPEDRYGLPWPPV